LNERISMDAAPEAREALAALERYLARSGLDRRLVELVKLRVSMMNGCAYCVDMHWVALRKTGVSERTLYGLSAWREQAGYSVRERAALSWAETLTRVADTHVPDGDYHEVALHFSTKEIADLSYVVAAINAWNRICVAFRSRPTSPPELADVLEE